MEISLGKESECERKACVGLEGMTGVRLGLEQRNRRIFKLERTVCKNDCLVCPGNRKELGLGRGIGHSWEILRNETEEKENK